MEATESIKKLADGSDFLLEEEIRNLGYLQEDIHIQIVRLSNITRPEYTKVYSTQSINNTEYSIDYSMLANIFTTDVRSYSKQYTNVSMFPYEMDDVSILMSSLNVTYATSDFPNVLLKTSYKFYNVSVSSGASKNLLDVIGDYKREKSKYIDVNERVISELAQEYASKINHVLVSDLIQNQRSLVIYVADYEDNINELLQEILNYHDWANDDSKSISFVIKQKGTNFNSMLMSLSAEPDENEIFKSLPSAIMHFIPGGSSQRYRIIKSQYSRVQHLNLTIDHTSFNEQITDDLLHSIEGISQRMVSSLVKDFIDAIMASHTTQGTDIFLLLGYGNYIRYQSQLLDLLASFTFRSPLNFIMVKHDFRIFLKEFLRCEAKLKYGFDFLQQAFLTRYSSGNLKDHYKTKLNIGIRFLNEKDNWKEQVCHIVHSLDEIPSTWVQSLGNCR